MMDAKDKFSGSGRSVRREYFGMDKYGIDYDRSRSKKFGIHDPTINVI